MIENKKKLSLDKFQVAKLTNLKFIYGGDHQHSSAVCRTENSTISLSNRPTNSGQTQDPVPTSADGGDNERQGSLKW